MAADKEEKRTDSKVEYYNRMSVCRVGYPSRPEVGDYVLSFMYRALLKMFTNTRRPAKVDSFTSLLYLFTNWNEFPECDVQDSAVEMTWAAPLRDEVEQDRMWDSVESVTYSSDEDSDTNGNTALFEEFFREMDDVTLLVRHDVLVRSVKIKASQRRRDGSVRRTWCRPINLGVVVLNLLSSCCGFTSAAPGYDLLRAHKECTRLVYRVARTLRRVLSEIETRAIYTFHPDGHVENGSVQSEDGDAGGEGYVTVGVGDRDDGRPRHDDVDGEQCGEDARRDDGNGVEYDEQGDGDAGDKHGSEGEVDEKDGGEGDGEGEGYAGEKDGDEGHEAHNEEGEGDAGNNDEGAVDGKDASDVKAKSTEDVEMDDDLDDSPERQDGKLAVCDFVQLFLGKDVATLFHFKQATCTVDAKVYWSNHIGADNVVTEKYGHIPIGKTIDDDLEMEGGDKMGQDEADDADAFGFE